MKKIVLGLLMIGTLFGQVNSVLTISPTASETILGNQSLAFRNPAMNNLNLIDSTSNISFTNVKWLGNIVDDMGFNYIEFRKGKLDYSLLYFNYGEQKFADETGLTVAVSHLPPGTSKWNKIEHRLFSYITKNWRGKPLVSYKVAVNLIARTKTNTGLKVNCELDSKEYLTGKKVSKKEMQTINIAKHDFHGEWNYQISPIE